MVSVILIDAIGMVVLAERDGRCFLIYVGTEFQRLGHSETRAMPGRTGVSTEYCRIANGTWPYAGSWALGT
jgi:hypothetical protein